MTDKALLIAALRQCADKLERDERERLFQTLDRKMADQQAAEAVREYRLLADLCEGRPDATEELCKACELALTFRRGTCTDPGCHVCKRNEDEMNQIKAAIRKAEGQ